MKTKSLLVIALIALSGCATAPVKLACPVDKCSMRFEENIIDTVSVETYQFKYNTNAVSSYQVVTGQSREWQDSHGCKIKVVTGY